MEKRFKRLGEAYRVLTDEREANKGDTPSGASEAPVPGRDLHYRIRLDFLLSARGGEATIRISRPALCPECAGMGDSDCPRCAGRAEVIIRDGIGVCLPSGLEEGETLRLPGEGAPGRFGGPPGDLYLIASPRNHPAFERRGLDVHSVVQLPAFRLMEGGPRARVHRAGGGEDYHPAPNPAGADFSPDGVGNRAEEWRRAPGKGGSLRQGGRDASQDGA